MKVISSGSQYEIYPDELKTHDKLPAGTYTVKFNPLSGFSLARITNFEKLEEKVYGAQEQKISKVLGAFDTMERSLGVILSGDKGIGKSLFTQLVSERVINDLDMPVILINRAFQGIADYIESIDQEVLVLFDEFEKVFDESKDGIESQDKLLGLFDGTSQVKRIYMITVNNLRRVNEFMLNRPGRFHYHFRFDYPNAEEIMTYLTDKVPSAQKDEIKNVVRFSQRVKLNYDCLRAIAFELTSGSTFSDAIADLNIINITDQSFSIKLIFDNAKTISIQNHALNLFAEEQEITCYDKGEEISVMFNPRDLVSIEDKLVIDADKTELEVIYYPSNDIYKQDETELKRIIISQRETMTYNYSAV